MTTALLLYALGLSAVLAAGAAVADRLLRGVRVPTRGLWAGALGLTVVLVALAPLRRDPSAARPPVEARAGTSGADRPSPSAAVTGEVAAAFPATPSSWPTFTVPARLDRALLLLWILSSATSLAGLALLYRRHRRRIASAERAVVAGVPVRLSDAFGPAVVGVRAPEIVVPRALLARAQEEQRLVVEHERSHVTAGDPALLLGACVGVAAMPWNPVAWHLLARLRLAMELDCDARLLRAGTAPAAYGSLLIELTSLLPHPRVGAPAFACRPSDLERRIVAMTTRPAPHARGRLVAAVAASLAIVIAACTSEIPTAAQVEEMDVAEAEARIGALPGMRVDDAVYVVDGVIVPRETAAALGPHRIASIEMQRAGVPRPVVNIRTTEAAASGGAGELRRRMPYIVRAHGDEIEVTPKGEERKVPADGAPGRLPSIVKRNTDAVGGQPLVLIDGIITTGTTELRGDRIASVEVIKGDAARAKYGERAAHGVILITTKRR